MNASPENTVCYPPNDHKEKCPITSIDFVGGDAIKSYESKSDYKVLKLSFDQALVYSKSTNSLPITTIRIENQPCVTAEKVSSAPGTLPLPNEIMQP